VVRFLFFRPLSLNTSSIARVVRKLDISLNTYTLRL
jgi:hypothetical protein